MQCRKSRAHFACAHKGMRQAMRLRAAASSRNELALRPADHHAAGLRQQGGTGHSFELLPELEGPLHHRHIDRMLEIGFPDDPRVAVRGSERMRRRMAVQPEHPNAAAREVKRRRTSHRTEAGDDHVIHGFSAHRERRTPN